MAVTVTTQPAQKLDPVKGIDFAPGSGREGIVVTGPTVFNKPGISGGRVIRGGGGNSEAYLRDLEARQRAEEAAKQQAIIKAQQEEQARQEALKKAQVEQQQRVYFVAEKTKIEKGKLISLDNQWKPSDPNAAVVYINNAGRTTGRSSGNISVPANINVRANTGQGTQQVGDVLARDIKNSLQSQRQQQAQTLPPVTQASILDSSSSDILPRKNSLGPIKTFIYSKGYQAYTFTNKIKQGGVKGFLFGESGEQFVGIGIPGIKFITFRDIKTKLSNVKGPVAFPARTASYLVPTTIAETSITLGSIGVYSVSSPVIKAGISGYTVYAGSKTAFNSGLSKEERIAGGIVGGLGALGTAYEVAPYAKGAIARFSPNYRAVSTEGNVRIIREVPRLNEASTFDIGLIPEGTLSAAKNKAAFEKGAYGFTQQQQGSYIGKSGDVTTSARSLIGIRNRLGQDIVVVSREVGVGPNGPEEFGLFATPFDLKSGKAQTRISRLGIQNLQDLFKSQTGGQISFSFFKESPQFVVFEKARITSKGGEGSFKAFGKASSELEVTAIPGSSITNIKKIGVTTLSGQKIDIFSAQLKGNSYQKPLSTLDLRKAGIKLSSTEPSKGVSGYSILSLATAYPSTSSSKSSSLKYKTSIQTYPVNISKGYSSNISPTRRSPIVIINSFSPNPKSSSKSSTPMSPQLTPSYSPPSNPKSSSITSPTRYPPFRSIPRPPYSPPVKSQMRPPYNPPSKQIKFTNYSYRKSNEGLFSVQIRRSGKFFNIGKASSLNQAINIGQSKVGRSLAATFKISGVGSARTPYGYYTKTSKTGLLFIEKRGLRLKRGSGEIPEIQSYKRRKRK